MENIVNTQQMEALRVLSETNMKVSEAKLVLMSLQKEEESYLQMRESKALQRVKEVLDESELLLQETIDNYSKVGNFAKEVSQLSESVVNLYTKFQGYIEEFNTRNELFSKNIDIQYDNLARKRKMIESDMEFVEKAKNSVVEAKKSVERDKEMLESRQTLIENSYKAESELWKRLQKVN